MEEMSLLIMVMTSLLIMVMMSLLIMVMTNQLITVMTSLLITVTNLGMMDVKINNYMLLGVNPDIHAKKMVNLVQLSVYMLNLKHSAVVAVEEIRFEKSIKKTKIHIENYMNTYIIYS